MDLNQIFQTSHPIIGVVHLLPLPTSPRWGGNLKTVIERAEQEAAALAAGGVDGIIVENFFDAPFTKGQVDPAVVSAMTLVIERLMNLIMLPVGINVLRNDAHSALAIAGCIGAPFIRVNVLTGVMATDQGLIEGKADELLRYRRELGTNTAIFADVLVKHARALGTPDLKTVAQETIERGLADGIIISGNATGVPPSLEDLTIAASVAQNTPILIGSGATWENVPELMKTADGVIVASSLKRHGKITETIDPLKVSQFVDAVRR
ncbi:photosystem I biogenesis protein BtpA [Gloeocapsa sp. PCC 73106]|uniref:photosystem I biogenesis protein BtpA n=1 Tax=Gloeocapsa sp. PCC 73106 TaxID=102232 RepID=UPI0002ACBEF5|nr:BtpA/SgcQ family protein [Gloeocapsa sp. PCC 73106]ELR96295.1 membrane complex biogenesis protein, BtpA family [Gloeocapsa sp. PCC 73106]